MDGSVLTQFQQKYESLAGVVHLVAGVEEAADVVAALLGEAKARRVALGAFSEPLREALAERCAALGLAVVQPPYASAVLARGDRCGPGRRFAGRVCHCRNRHPGGVRHRRRPAPGFHAAAGARGHFAAPRTSWPHSAMRWAACGRFSSSSRSMPRLASFPARAAPAISRCADAGGARARDHPRRGDPLVSQERKPS